VKAYLDTQVVVWLAEARLERISNAALDAVNEHDLVISPVVLIELNYLHQIKRILRSPLDIAKQLRTQLGLEICQLTLADIAETALFETWTRDPFDLLIVANAKAGGYAPLLTSDEKIRAHYPRAVW
jgi:PIN domain nuclease of toxin-antitoxin system